MAMTAEWTAERLDALPEGAVIRWTEDGYPEIAIRGDRSWRLLSGHEIYSETVGEDADPGSIRVVSVPVDALLSDETMRAAGEGHYLGQPNSRVRTALHLAVAHITGEAL